MPVGEVLTRHTHRQFSGFVEWIKQGWNRPSRTDNYLMLLATRVQQVLAKDPNKVKMEANRLKFDLEGRPEKTPQEKAQESKAAWLGWAQSIGAKIEPEDVRLGEVKATGPENFVG